jgi:hypothetical protein
LIIRIVFIEKNITQSSSLCILLHSPVTSSFLDPICSQHPIFKHFQHISSLCDRNTFPYRLTFQGKPHSNLAPQYSNSTTTTNAGVAMILLVIDQFPVYKTHNFY